MLLLDLSNEILLNILSLIDPVDLVNIYNVSRRLRDLAEWTINKVVLKLHFTGINSFPKLKHQPFNDFERIRVNRNWINGKFSRKEFFANFLIQRWKKIVVDDHFYVAEKGAIRKYDRDYNGECLSSEFQLIGNINHPEISNFAKKDNVIFACYQDGSCIRFQDEKPIMERGEVLEIIRGIDLYPKEDIYVTASFDGVQVLNQALVPVARLSGADSVKIDLSGEKLITGNRDIVTLYDLNSKEKDLLGLNGVCDLLWKDNHTFLSGHDDSYLKLFDLRTKSVCQKMRFGNDFNVSIQFDGENTVFCGLAVTNTVCICDLRMIKDLKYFDFYDEEEEDVQLLEIIAEPKYLFVVTDTKLHICDFSA